MRASEASEQGEASSVKRQASEASRGKRAGGSVKRASEASEQGAKVQALSRPPTQTVYHRF